MSELHHVRARHVHNRLADRTRPYGADESAVLDRASWERAQAEIAGWPGYRPTPLVALPGLAARLGVGRVAIKDEGQRFGLGSFKAIGGAYALLRLLQDRLSRTTEIAGPSAADLIAGRAREHVGNITAATATDGNHGRSVAWAARMFGCRSVIYIHENVSAAREREIAAFGADIRRVPGSYDDSVRRCATDAAFNGWLVVADTSTDGDTLAPRLVMEGYTLIAAELLAQWAPAAPPSHVFVPAGVGGLAAALAASFWDRFGSRRPRLVVVEPMAADCVFRTVAAGRPTPVPGRADSFMACLAAAEVSPVAWAILRGGADDVIALPEEAAANAMRFLAAGTGDAPVVAGESGAAAAAALAATALDPALRRALALGPDSGVIVIGSEGATDRETYERVVGLPPERVSAGQA